MQSARLCHASRIMNNRRSVLDSLQDLPLPSCISRGVSISYLMIGCILSVSAALLTLIVNQKSSVGGLPGVVSDSGHATSRETFAIIRVSTRTQASLIFCAIDSPWRSAKLAICALPAARLIVGTIDSRLNDFGEAVSAKFTYSALCLRTGARVYSSAIHFRVLVIDSGGPIEDA